MANAKIPGTLSPAALRFDELAGSARVDVKTVADIFGVSPVTVWRYSQKGLIPKPHKQGSCTRWIVRELREAMAAAEAA